MFNNEVTEMNYKQKISRETSPSCNPKEPSLFNLHFGIREHAVNVLAEHVNLLSDERIMLNEDSRSW